jgi:phosphotransferase system enzyme I (PtsP)
MFAQDRGWLDRIEEALQGGLTAEAAVRRVQDDMRARFRHARDANLPERLHDLDDLSNRLLQHLLGEDGHDGLILPDDAIVVARAMGPAQLLDYDRSKLKGVILEEGSPTAHVAIVARALDVPVIGNVDDVLGKIEPGDPVIVDGNNGIVFVRPSAEARASFGESIKVQAEKQAGYAAMRELPAETRDGVRVTLKLNGGFLIDAQQIAPRGAEGIGLYRTELPFMVRHDFPDADAQAELYGRVLDAADGKPVTFRTLDIGGDKLLPYWRPGRDENPALGWRAIRLSLDRPALMRTQLRGLLRAAAGRELEIMFPMVAEVAEFERARSLLDAERKREVRRGTTPPARVAVGVMLEVPALIWQLPALLPRVDFVSVGSNDLLQFLFAADRNNPRLVGRYDNLAPAVLACLADIADRCTEAGKPFAFCGDMAGNPLEAMALIAVGYRSISMPAPAVGPIKAMVRSLELEPLANYVRSLATAPDHSLREKLRSYATDRGVLI